MAHGTFATVLGCIDGRASIPTMAYLQQVLGVDYVDYIAEPGPEKVYLEATPEVRAALHQKLTISLQAHHSHAIAVAAHHECAGNPVSREDHEQAVLACVTQLQHWQPEVRVLGLWVNDQWQVELLCDTGATLASSAS